MSGKTSFGSNSRPGTGVFIPPAAFIDNVPVRNTPSTVYDSKQQRRKSLDSQLERIFTGAHAEQDGSNSRVAFPDSMAVHTVGRASLHGAKSCRPGESMPHLPASALHHSSEVGAASAQRHRHSFALGEKLMVPSSHFAKILSGSSDAQAARNTSSAARSAFMGNATAAIIDGIPDQYKPSPVSTPAGTPKSSTSGGPPMLPSSVLKGTIAPMGCTASWQQQQQQAPVASAFAVAETDSSSSFGFGQMRPSQFQQPQLRRPAQTVGAPAFLSAVSGGQQMQLQQACTGGYSSCQFAQSGPHQVQLMQQRPAVNMVAPLPYSDEELLLAEIRLQELLEAGAAGIGAAAGSYNPPVCPTPMMAAMSTSSGLLPMMEGSLPLLPSPSTTSGSPLTTPDNSMDLVISSLLYPPAGVQDAIVAASAAITAATTTGVRYCVMQNEQSQQQHKLCMSAVASALSECGSCSSLSLEAMEKLQQLVAVQQLQLDLQSELLQLMPVA